MKKIKIFEKLHPTNLFYNNKFVILFSVAASLALWVVVSVSDTVGKPVTVSDIPVNLSLSESAERDGLRVFSGHDVRAQVDIKGSRLTIGQVRGSDIQIVPAQINTINSPGNYTLELSAKKAGRITDYEFASAVRPALLPIMVDRYREVELAVETDVSFTANPECFVGNLVLSEPKIVLSGPEGEVARVKKIMIGKKIEEELTESRTFKTPVILLDEYGDVVAGKTIVCSANEVEVTIPVLTCKRVPVRANFTNKPKGLDLTNILKITPSELEIAGSSDAVKNLGNIVLPEINFNKIDIKNNQFDLHANLPQGCRTLDNNYSVKVELNLSKFKEKTLWVTNFSFINIPLQKTGKVYNQGIDVRIIGPSSKISAIKGNNLTAKIDLKNNNDLQGHMEMPAEITVNGYSEVWACGEYFVNTVLSEEGSAQD
jgi:YbbR domain-containing protein